jgi:hypothetical protein
MQGVPRELAEHSLNVRLDAAFCRREKESYWRGDCLVMRGE